MPSVEEVVARHGAGIKDPKIWFTPNIPADKLQRAIRAYAQVVSPGEALMLVDNTIWGGCGDGMLITRDRLYAHDMTETARAMGISEIKTVNVIGSFSPALFINGSKFVTFNCIDIHGQASHVKICLLITELAMGCISTTSPAISQPGGGVSPEVQECSGCGAAVRGLAVCGYCGRKL